MRPGTVDKGRISIKYRQVYLKYQRIVIPALLSRCTSIWRSHFKNALLNERGANCPLIWTLWIRLSGSLRI